MMRACQQVDLFSSLINYSKKFDILTTHYCYSGYSLQLFNLSFSDEIRHLVIREEDYSAMRKVTSLL